MSPFKRTHNWTWIEVPKPLEDDVWACRMCRTARTAWPRVHQPWLDIVDLHLWPPPLSLMSTPASVRGPQGLEKSEYSVLWYITHVLLTSHPAYRYPQTLVDDSMSYQHPTSFRGLWVIYGLLQALPCDEEKLPHASPLVGMWEWRHYPRKSSGWFIPILHPPPLLRHQREVNDNTIPTDQCNTLPQVPTNNEDKPPRVLLGVRAIPPPAQVERVVSWWMYAGAVEEGRGLRRMGHWGIAYADRQALAEWWAFAVQGWAHPLLTAASIIFRSISQHLQ